MLLGLPSATVERVNMVPLFAHADHYHFASLDKGLQRRLLERLADTYNPAKGSEFHYALYQQVVGPFLTSIAPVLGAMVREVSATRASDLFVWSALTGNERLMRLFWVRCEKPVHMALLCAHLFGKMGRAPQCAMFADELAVHEQVMRS